jgi:hypothetical protein
LNLNRQAQQLAFASSSNEQEAVELQARKLIFHELVEGRKGMKVLYKIELSGTVLPLFLFSQMCHCSVCKTL